MMTALWTRGVGHTCTVTETAMIDANVTARPEHLNYYATGPSLHIIVPF